MIRRHLHFRVPRLLDVSITSVHLSREEHDDALTAETMQHKDKLEAHTDRHNFDVEAQENVEVARIEAEGATHAELARVAREGVKLMRVKLQQEQTPPVAAN